MSAALANESPPSWEERLSARCQRFDVGPLVRLLERKGFRVLFESNRGRATSPTLVESLRFDNSRAIIKLNRGLLGEAALLPDYFIQWINQSRESENFYDFIRFFDHRLLSDLVTASYPELGTTVFGNWSECKRSYLSMLGVGSTVTLKWLLQLCFPELVVDVTRVLLEREDQGHTTRPGYSDLDGRNVVGRSYDGQASGFVVKIVTFEEADELGRRWATVARKRLQDEVMPFLDPFHLHLSIDLVVDAYYRHYRSPRLSTDVAGELGTDRMYGRDGLPHVVRLFRGVTGEDE